MQRRSARKSHASQPLRQWLEHAADFARRPALLDQNRQNLQRRQNAIAGGREIGQDHMAGLLPPDVETAGTHFLGNIAVSYLGAMEIDAATVEKPLQTEIGHHGGNDAATGEPAAIGPIARDQRKDLVAVHDLAVLVGHQHPVRVAVQRDAEMRTMFQHLGAEIIRDGRAAALVDVEAVGLYADLHDIGAKLPQHRWRHPIGRAVGAIDHDLKAIQPQAAWKTSLSSLDIAAASVLQPVGAAEFPRSGETIAHIRGHQSLDANLHFVRQLKAVRTK